MPILLAFAFGYSLTMLPLLRAALGLSAALPPAFASDSISLAVMETVDIGLAAIVAPVTVAVGGAVVVEERHDEPPASAHEQPAHDEMP